MYLILCHRGCSIDKQVAAIIALPFTSELFIKSFSYFRQNLHHIQFTIVSPVKGCTTVFTPNMLLLPQLLNAFIAMEFLFFSFGIFDVIMSTVLINLLMFGKEDKLTRTHLVQKKMKKSTQIGVSCCQLFMVL